MNYDPAEIARDLKDRSYQKNYIKEVLARLFEPGQVVELRCPIRTNRTISGYFNDFEKLATEAAKLSGNVPGVYITVNPVEKSLIARSSNRVQDYAKSTTSDNQILQRRFFLLDIDPVRPSGISSSDAEHQAAIDLAYQVKEWLQTEFGFAEILIADSGNGAHLMIRVDLPNDDATTDLLKRCIEAVAFRFEDAVMSFDRTIYNAAQIWKLYGTKAQKGDNIAERPHRYSNILEAPERWTVTPVEPLQRLAATIPEEPRSNGEKRRSQLDLAKWIADNGLDVIGPRSWNNAQLWLFPICPWNSDHTNRSAYIIQFPNGAIAARCHHNRCAGKNWHDLRDSIEPGWREKQHNYGTDGANQSKESGEGNVDTEKSNPWAFVQDAPTLLAEEEKEFKGIAKELLAPGAVTMIAAPRGLGKTHVAEAVAVAIACGGVFRNEQVPKLRVLLLDRDNPRSEVKKRLKAWGAGSAENLKVLTRETAPDLKDKTSWENFPVSDYDVIIIDSVGSSTEGITEKEGKETTQVLATLLDVARKGPAILLLTNCTKDALNLKGRGEWADRVDILYEVRDATGFTPSGKKAWWQELPEAGESAWAERAARRKGRLDYRLAFIPSKFRLGPEPEPFCLEIRLPKDEQWTLADVTTEVLKAGEEAIEAIKRKEEERLQKAAQALAEVVKDRAAKASPILKTEAENFLHEMEITRKDARELITNQNGKLWTIQDLPRKGSPKGLYPLAGPDYTPASAAKMPIPAEPYPERVSETPISAAHAQSGRQKYPSRKGAPGADEQDTLFSPPEVVSSQEIGQNDEETWEDIPI